MGCPHPDPPRKRKRGEGDAGADGAFGDVTLVGAEAVHGAGAQTLLQAVDELGQGLGRRTCRVHRQRRLPFRQGLRRQHMDGGGLETELGIEHAAQTIEAQRDQAGDVAGVTTGRGEADVDRASLAIDAEEQKAQVRARRRHRATDPR